MFLLTVNQFANNVAKFILSIGPQTTKEKGVFQIDLVRTFLFIK
jgi:hypothetical protein